MSFPRGGASISKGSLVRFDTYFNAFFYPKYLAYTYIAEVALRAVITGTLQLRLLCWTSDAETCVLSEMVACGTERQVSLPACSLADLPRNGAIYLEVRGLSEVAFLHRGWFETNALPRRTVNIGAVICTFQREAYVARNLAQLQQTVWDAEDCPIREDLDVFVIDNGRTLAPKSAPHLQIIPNKNYGGSGGFARGMLEVCQRERQYTHVLLMDDDVSIETEALVKTIQLLKFARDFEQPLWIGGQMLLEDQPTMQFEAGACYVGGRLRAFHRGLDLSRPENLLRNEQPQNVQYNAWWYCCIPVECIARQGLPLPLFIKTDDVEYGLRCKPRVLLMNGIGIWHMPFSQKYSPHLEYYIKRNELVVSALHHSGDGSWPGIWKLLRASGKAILTGNTGVVDFFLLAYRDFLQGPDFFLDVEDEDLNSRLLERSRASSGAEKHGVLTIPFRLLAMSVKFLFRYPATRRAFLARAPELTSVSFWRRRLGIPS